MADAMIKSKESREKLSISKSEDELLNLDANEGEHDTIKKDGKGNSGKTPHKPSLTKVSIV